MDVTLPFICLGHKEIRNMPADAIFVADGITTEDFLQSVKTLAFRSINQ